MIKFSKTRLNTFLSCGEKYRLHYELGLRPLKSAKPLVEGSAIHHLVENGLLYGNKIDDVLEQASRCFWEENPPDNCAYASKQEYQNAQQTCLDQSRKFLELMGPLNVRSTELYLEHPLVHPITLEEDPDIELVGYLDLVITDEQGKIWLLDLKTMGRTPSQATARIALELSLYAYLFAHTEGGANNPANIPVALVNLVRTKNPKVLWDKSNRSLTHFLELHQLCKKVADDIRSYQFLKNPGMHCGWCDYQSLCYENAKEAKQLFSEEQLELYQLDKFSALDVLLTESTVVNF